MCFHLLWLTVVDVSRVYQLDLVSGRSGVLGLRRDGNFGNGKIDVPPTVCLEFSLTGVQLPKGIQTMSEPLVICVLAHNLGFVLLARMQSANSDNLQLRPEYVAEVLARLLVYHLTNLAGPSLVLKPKRLILIICL